MDLRDFRIWKEGSFVVGGKCYSLNLLIKKHRRYSELLKGKGLSWTGAQFSLTMGKETAFSISPEYFGDKRDCSVGMMVLGIMMLDGLVTRNTRRKIDETFSGAKYDINVEMQSFYSNNNYGSYHTSVCTFFVSLLLVPVESSWKQNQSLVLVTLVKVSEVAKFAGFKAEIFSIILIMYFQKPG